MGRSSNETPALLGKRKSGVKMQNIPVWFPSSGIQLYGILGVAKSRALWGISITLSAYSALLLPCSQLIL